MSRPQLDPDLAAALEALTRAFGPPPPHVLEVRPARHRPAPPPAPGPDPSQPGLFDPEPAPPAPTDPSIHVSPSRRWRGGAAPRPDPIASEVT